MSIMQDMSERVCFMTGETEYTTKIDLHHIMNGPFKKKSEEQGLLIYLRHDIHMWLHHTGNGKKTLLRLKQEAQKKWEEVHANDYEDVRKEWMKIFKTNYL